MCGILGFSGSGPVREVAGRGLEMLQYRGYDSCGYAFLGESGFSLRRRAGKGMVSELVSELPEISRERVFLLAHTRWATHGPPTEENAHPLADCRGEIAVVHNGIVENYAFLKKKLEAGGHLFRSATDTEVIAHLLEEETGRGSPLEKAVITVAGLLEGNFAFLALDRRRGCLAGARHGSPLMVGYDGRGSFHISSDLNSLPETVEKVAILEDGQALVAGEEVLFFSFHDGSPATPACFRHEPRRQAAVPGNGSTWMFREIMEQPAALERTLEGLKEEWRPGNLGDALGKVERLVILGCGTSWHAALVAEYMLEDLLGIPVEVEYASEFRYRNPVVKDGDLLVAVSQSGETADTLGALKNIGGRCRTVAVCNVRDSAIARESGLVLYTGAGPEIGVASTKAFTTQLAAFYFLALSLAATGKNIAGRRPEEILDETASLGRATRDLLRDIDGEVSRIAARFDEVSNALFLGRGLHFPIALEGALKLKEISYIHAEGYPAAEMKHGPIALIDEKMPVIFLAVEDQSLPRVLSNMEEVRSRGGSIITVTDSENAEIGRLSEEVIRVPRAQNDYLKPIFTVMPLQLLAYYAARRRGCDVDKPRNLAKSVTVE